MAALEDSGATMLGAEGQPMADATNRAHPPYEAEVGGFRQPMVTSIGIILGFQLAFLANWALTAEKVPAVTGLADTVLAVTFMGSIALFTFVLYRVLNNRIFPNPGERYQVTLRVYLSALILAFFGLAVALFV